MLADSGFWRPFRILLRYSVTVTCKLWHRRVFAVTLAAIAAAGAGGVAFTLYRASRVVQDSAARIAAEAEIRITASPLDRASSRFEPIAAPAVFEDAAVYQGRLFVCGPSGLLEYDGEGGLKAQYRAGVDLPGPLAKLAVGVAGAGTPELFIATAGEGLLVFDGRGFRQVRPEEAPYRTVTALLAAPTGRLLLGTHKKGVLVYDGKRLAPFHPSLDGLDVTALVGDDSDLWVGTVTRGVFHWRSGVVERFGEAEGLPDARVLSLAAAGGSAWAGTAIGVAEFKGGRLARTLAPGVFAESLLPRGAALAVGTLNQGVLEVALGSARPREARSVAEPLPGKVTRLLDAGGALYAVSDSGLYLVDQRRGGWRRVLDPESAPLTDRNISALAFDAAGKLWAGYFDRGLDILDPGLTRATHIEDDRIFCINRIVEDRRRGIVAVASANGLTLFDTAGVRRQTLGRAEGLIANHVTDVAIRPGGMTIATPAGLTFVDERGVRSLYAFHGLVNNHVYALAGVGERLLAGTLGGLSVLDGDAVRANYTTANSAMRANWITAIAQAGAEWFVGTYGAGVLRFDAAGRWQSFPDLRASFEVNPNAMLTTSRAVYAGSLSSGLYIYDRAAGRWSEVRAGLPSPNVTALAERDGYIYVGTDNGLVRFRENL